MKNDQHTHVSKRKVFSQGIAVFALYALMLTEQEPLIHMISDPSFLTTALIISLAFLFSYLHGSFTHNFWTMLGIEASKKYQK